MYIAMISDPSVSRYIYLSNEARKEGLLGWREDIGGHETKVGVLDIGASKGIQGGADVKERVDGKGEGRGTKVVRKFLYVVGVGKVVTEVWA